MPKLKPDETVVETFAVDIDDEPVRANQKRSKVSMLASDALLLAVEHIQIYGIILSLSLAWPWSYDWIKVNSIVFFFNLDLWEFTKVHTVYQSQMQAYSDPNVVPFNYIAYALTWLFITIVMPSIFAGIYFTVPRLSIYGPLDVILFREKLIQVFLIIAQLLTIPLGIVIVRLFDCQQYPDEITGELEFRSIVLKETQCWNVTHLGIMVPLLWVAAIYIIALPSWMVFNIWREINTSPVCCTCCSSWRAYEQNILLKEAEFVQEIDLTWAIRHYSLFSSFRRPWVWYRAYSFLTKVLILGIYGGLFYQQVIQTIVLFTLFAAILLTVLIVPVYRVRIFNFLLIFSIFINLCNITLGLLLSLGVQSALLFGQNLINSLLVVNLAWGICVGIWFTYIYLRSQKIIGKRLGPMWPVLPELDSSDLFRNEHTEKFFQAILGGRRVLEKCYSTTEFFAPVHELSRQIQIINAYCREAEVLEDPAHPSLWAFLAEMVDAHSSIAPNSIYGTSTKGSIPQKVEYLMELIPTLKKRLEQREYDFILWTPINKRILLKLLAVSTFLRRRSKRIRIPVEISYSNLKNSRPSTISFLNDDCEDCNDRFLIDIEKWEAMRKKSLLPVDGNQLLPSIGSLQMDNTREVELWEDNKQYTAGHREKRSYSIQSTNSVDRLLEEVEDWQESHVKHIGEKGIISRNNVSSRSSGDQIERASLSLSPLTGRRQNMKSSSSRLSVRFNLLDTIDELDGWTQQCSPESTVSSMGRPDSTMSSTGRPDSTMSSMGRPGSTVSSSSYNSTDRLISGVEEEFPDQDHIRSLKNV